MEHFITLPFEKAVFSDIRKMDILYLTGTVYTARDAAHKRMYDTIVGVMTDLAAAGEEKNNIISDPAGAFEHANESVREAVYKALPFNIRDSVIYYLGPAPAKPGQVIGSAGPTTSTRMDKYTPLLLELGLKGMIGKGRRSDEVVNSIKKNNAVYMGATGGAGALLSKCIKSSEIIAYDDLGTEAIRKLYVESFPVTVLSI